MGENPGAVLYKENEEGGGRFFLASAATEAVQCAVDLSQWSVLCKSAFCLKAGFAVLLLCVAVLMHCVHALTTTTCCFEVSSCISITSGHL